MADSPKIRHRPLVPFDQGTLREDAATFYVNNKVFEGFKNINISRNLMSLTGTFEITIVDKWRVERLDFEILPGDRIHCHIGKLAVFEGYVDTFNINVTAGSRNLTLSGRDRTSDLVDSSVIGNAEYNNLDLEQIAIQLVKPFGLKVLKNVDVGKPFEKFTIRQGETIFGALNRGAKDRQLILLSTTHGNLLIDKRGSKRAKTELIEGINILQSGATFDNSERFSEYHVKGQQSGILGDASDTNASLGKAFDEGMTRFRPNLIISEQSVDNEAAQKRAEFEATFKAAKATKVSVTVLGWRQKDGSLWEVNQIVHLENRSVGIKSDMLINAIRYVQGVNGRKVELELVRKDAFEFKKTIKKSDDILDSLGWGS